MNVLKISAKRLSILLLWVIAFAASPAFASHLRGISLTYQPTSTPGTVQFTFLYSYRATSGCNEHSPCQVGDTVDTFLDMGDGSQESPVATVTSVNSTDDYMIAVATFTHAYTGNGPYTAQYSDCCRLSNLKVGANGSIVISTTVYPFSTNHPPVSSMPAILAVPLANSTSFQLIAADPDGDTLHYRLGTAEETFAQSSYSCGSEPPPGLTVDQTGLSTWDTTQIAASSCGYGTPQIGDLWTAHIMVEDVDSSNNVKSSIGVDVILKFVSSAQDPPTLTFDQTSPLTVAPGTTLTLNATANNAAANSRVMINVAGQPVGSTATNLNQLLSPALTSAFTWTPTVADAGFHLLTYVVTNDTFQQKLAGFIINVPNVQPPTLSCPTSVAGQYGIPPSIPLTVTDPQGHAVTVVWTLDSNVVQTDNVAASSSASSLSYSGSFLSVGSHTLSITATNTDNQSSTCAPPVTISKADQTITFAALSNMSYGDADAALSTTASSSLAVSLSASGNCSIINGSVHANGVGNCSVTASQAGNGNYNAAVDVTRSFSIGKRTLTVTATDATRAYGVANPTFTGTLTGVVAGDTITASYASTATSISSVGTYAIVPSLTGDLTNYSATSNNGTLTVTKVLLTVTADNATRAYGVANPTFTGTLNGVVAGDTITASYASTATTASPAGTYAIIPTLSGDLTNYSVTSNNGTLTVTKIPLTVTAANVTRAYGVANPTFTGTLTGMLAGDSITATYATVATTSSPVGTYAIVPTLSGDLTSYNVSSNNGTLTITKTTPVIAWTPPASIGYGTNLNSVLTAAASANSVAVPGVFTYTTSTGTLASSAVLPAGSYALNTTFIPTDTVNYNNNTAWAALVVNKINPAGVVLSTSSSTVLLTNNVTFTAVVSSPISTPTGSVTFMNGATALASVPLTNGTASYTNSTLAVGSSRISAIYSGDSNFTVFSSNALSQTVIDFTFNVTASPNNSNSTNQIIYPGQTATFVFTLSPNSPATTFPSAVNLWVSGIPTGATYTLTPTVIAAGSGATTATLTVTVPSSYAKNDMPNRSKAAAALAFALLLLPFSGRMRRSGKRFGRLLTLLLLIAAGAMATTGLTGCGTSSGLYGHGEQTSNLTITGTSGNLSHSVNLTLKVE